MFIDHYKVVSSEIPVKDEKIYYEFMIMIKITIS